MALKGNPPLFSIITPTYNAADVIAPTLASVERQTCDDYEFILVDGASADGTVAMVRQSRVKLTRLLSERDRGLYDAMNKGMGLAGGEYLIFLDAGDSLADDGVLERLSQKAREGGYDILYGQTQLVDGSGRVVGDRHLAAPEHLTAESFKHGMLVCHQAFVARRSVAPLYDLRFRFSSDYDWCIRCLQRSHSNGYMGTQPIISYLTSPDGLTVRNHTASLWERFNIMCHYYGTLPTVLRHLSFLPRYFKERRRQKLLKKNEP